MNSVWCSNCCPPQALGLTRSWHGAFAFLRIFGSRPALGLTIVLMSPGLIPTSAAGIFPDTIPLPNGFQPEGIEIGRGNDFFVGSIPTGAIYKGDIRTGQGALLVEPVEGRAAVGLGFDPRNGDLFVAGGGLGTGYLYDGETGKLLGQWQFASPPTTFINDVVVTRDAAYFTDSRQPVLYRVPLGPGGELSAPGAFEAIPLSGDFEFVPGVNNANGIDATPNGEWLIVVNSSTGKLYRVDPLSGGATEIELTGIESVTAGDGILLQGHTLYVVRNRLNEIAVLELDPTLTEGTLVDTIRNPNFRVPTTIDRHGNALYVVNARFGTPPSPATDYDVVRVEKR